MRKEYQAIVDKWREKERNFAGFDGISGAVAECEALADKPPKMLTDEEIEVLTYSGPKYLPFARAIELAHIAKQQEPETRMVKIYIYKDQDGDIHAATAGTQVPDSITMIDSFEREVTI